MGGGEGEVRRGEGIILTIRMIKHLNKLPREDVMFEFLSLLKKNT